MYRQIEMLGVWAYTNAFILDDEENLVMASVFGRPALVKAIVAGILERKPVNIEGIGTVMRPPSTAKTKTAVVEPGCWLKVFSIPDFFNGDRRRVVLGKDKVRAFHFVQEIVSTPMKPEWANWVWENVLDTTETQGFGVIDGKDLSVTRPYLIEVQQTDADIDYLVIEALRQGTIS
jgi:hypothetical protein